MGYFSGESGREWEGFTCIIFLTCFPPSQCLGEMVLTDTVSAKGNDKRRIKYNPWMGASLKPA